MERGKSPTEQLFAAVSRFRSKWPKGGWSWDNRFSCVASSFHVELVSEAHTAATELMPFEWSMRNVGGAPTLIREVAESTGGIRPDQLLLSTDPNARLVTYGLWWPWGDDITISLRIGLTGFASDADNHRFRQIFNALD